MLNVFFENIERFSAINPEIKAEIKKIAIINQYPKNHLLLKKGDVSTHIHYLTKGMVRVFYERDKKEITSYFVQENNFFTSSYSYITQTPSYENMIFLEESSVISFHHSDITSLYDKYKEMERLGRIIAEFYAIGAEQYLMSIRFHSARQRYENLMQTQPEVIKRVPLQYIASYLGISQETLSRIRSNVK